MQVSIDDPGGELPDFPDVRAETPPHRACFDSHWGTATIDTRMAAAARLAMTNTIGLNRRPKLLARHLWSLIKGASTLG